MKKYSLIALGIVILLGFIFIPIQAKKDSPERQVELDQVPLTEQLSKACQILTEDTAGQLLSKDIQKTDDANAASASSDDIAVSQCSYEQKTPDGSSVDDQHRVSLLVRSARSEKGISANASVFENGSMPASAQVVSGFGEAAFWNPDFGQLNILNRGNWYIVENGPITPQDRKQANAEKLAKVLIDKL